MTLTFFSMFCSLSGISLSWKTLVFGRFTSQERTNVHRTAFFLHTPDFSLSKVTALKVVWGKDTSRRSKEPGSDLPSCFSAWTPFCKCGWRHHISRSGCGPDCRSNDGKKFSTKDKMEKKYSTASIEVCDIKIYHWLKYSNKTFLSRSATKCQQFRLVTHSRPLQAPPMK